MFQYGNKVEALQQRQSKASSAFHSLSPKTFPFLLSKQLDYFNFNDCSYSMPKSKESTARIAMFFELKVPFVFTLEASFAGASKGKLSGQHFSIANFENVGNHSLKYSIREISFKDDKSDKED